MQFEWPGSVLDLPSALGSADFDGRPPAGPMAPYLGRRLEAEFDSDKEPDEAEPLMHLIRAFQVAALVGQTISIQHQDELSPALIALIRRRLPAIAWEPDHHIYESPADRERFDQGYPRFCLDHPGPHSQQVLNHFSPAGMIAARFQKTFFLHTSLPAPPDDATGQPMALEVYGEAIHADGRDLATAAGREWFRDWRWSRERDNPVTVPVTLRIDMATYANVRHPGIGVPFYF
jgi:hypothetical protein